MRYRFSTYDALFGEAFTRSGGSATGARQRAEAVPVLSLFFIFPASFLLILLLSSPGWTATPPGAIISNTASASFTPSSSGVPRTISSNASSVTTTIVRTKSVIEYLQYAPESPAAKLIQVPPSAYSPSGSAAGPFTPLEAPAPAGSATPLELGAPVPLVPPSIYHAGEPVFILLTDGDQNNAPDIAETVVVAIRDDKNGDTEVLRLTETGPNTGVFLGPIQSSAQPAVVNNGVLCLVNDSHLIAFYADEADPADTSSVSAMVDPFGILFNSATGKPVDGAVVTLVETATGLPAVVYGDDGVSSYPSAVTTGSMVTDGSGRAYTMSPGGYRFPFIKPGRYRLQVLPPAGYRVPSTVATAVLQTLSGAPFAIAEPGSRGEEFVVNAGPAIHIDIPADPLSTTLYLIKTAQKESVAIGDFSPYTLRVENLDTLASAPGLSIVDRLPHAFRYRKGSARLNTAPLADPVVSSDGRGLTFIIGELGPGAHADVLYVAEVGAGARPGRAVNSAVASGPLGAVSNIATASVKVTEDLMMSKTTIVGRVFDGCNQERGIAGVRIFLEDGTFVVTDAGGRYHFAAVDPGAHVVQLDTVTLADQYESTLCEDNTRSAGTAFSQFVDLQGGSLWRADFHLGMKSKVSGEVSLELRSSLVSTGTTTTPGVAANGRYDIAYSISAQVAVVPVRALRVIVMLPDDVTYQPGTSRLDNAPLPDPDIASGVLSYLLGGRPAGWTGTVLFNGSAPAAGATGELATKAFLIFDAPEAKNVRSPLADTSLVRHVRRKAWTQVVLHPEFATYKASLSRSDKQEVARVVQELKNENVEHITVIGHTDSIEIRKGADGEFPDNYILSRERAKTVASAIAAGLRLAPEQITIVGKGPDEPIASNNTEEGRARNRRVELNVDTRHPSLSVWTEVRNEKEYSGRKTVPTGGQAPGESRSPNSKETDLKSGRTMPDYDAAWREKARPGLSWLWPNEGHHPPIPSLNVAIKHGPSNAFKLLLNGTEVEAFHLDNTATRPDNKVAVTFWRGIHLVDGDNVFEAVEYDENGVATESVKRVVHYSTSPVKAEPAPAGSQLVADGRTPPLIAVRLMDKDGHPAREGLIGEYSVDPPHLPRKRVQKLEQSPLLESVSERLRYTVGEDGMALIELEPTMNSGEAVIRFNLASGFQELRAWLKPEDRDWILVGLAEGTVGYNTVTGNMENLLSSGGEDKFYDENRVAFYAKGRVKGEWLLTLAYDSKKADSTDQPGLYQTIDPNKYYTLYGDGTMQGNDAASAKRVYVKLERGQFYALFGDYPTGLTVTELSRYNRNLTGFKSELKTDTFQYSVFVSDTDQAYVRDEVSGDGTSGLYHLSRKNIVLNSETITIETRDRFMSEHLVSTQRLVRSLDYTIDYENGTIFFKSPVYSRDGNFNPVFIVAEYESFDSSDRRFTYGGRGAATFLDNRVEVGASHIHEGQRGGSGDLEGLDAKIKLGDTDTLRAEAATTKTEQSGMNREGDSYLAELQHRSVTMEGKIYAREQAVGFGLGQQNGSETGTRKIGGDISYRIAKPVTVGGELFRQENLATGAARNMEELRSNYVKGPIDILAGLRNAEDSLGNGEARRSEQVFAGMRYQLTERAAARVRRDQSIGPNDNVDFPTRTIVGMDYKLNESALLFADQEWTNGSNGDTETTRIGIKSSPWTGGQVGSTIEQQTTENGIRLFSTMGLKQSWQITKQWSVDGGLDRSTTVRNTADYTVNANVPPASGGREDFTATSLGAGYRQENWSWTARIEERVSDSERRHGLFTGANGEVRSGLGLAAGIQVFQSSAVSGLERRNENLRLSLAKRPAGSGVIILDRLEGLLTEQRGGGVSSDRSRRIINNLVTNTRVGDRTQVSFQYAAKYVQETIEQNDYRGYTDLVGLEGRYDMSKTWDAGLRVMRLRSWGLDQEQYGAGASVGFNAGRNIWISLGYNFTGFRDRDFSRADFTSEGPFIKLRMKFDQVSVRDAVKWFSGQ